MKGYPIVAALAVFGGFAGCWSPGIVQIYSCDDPCIGLDDYGCMDPCAVCEGECLELAPLGFDDPMLLWRGDTAEAPAPDCPEEAPDLAFDGYEGPSGAHECPSCRCEDPACELPRGLEGSASTTCDGTAPTSFDAPAGWDGACTAPAAAPPGELGSLLIPPPTSSACAPAPDLAEVSLDLPAPWARRARGCAGSAAKYLCRDPRKMCIASPVPRPQGFSMCARYLRSDVPKCPEEYPELRAFYEDFEDTRACTPCACEPAEGSTCTALVSAYEDGRCGQLLGAETVTLAGPVCVTGPDIRLESMDARWIRNEPGSCAPSGGVATGQVTPSTMSYFCCMSDESIPIP